MLLGEDDRRVDLVVAFDFDDGVFAIGAMHQEVGVVAADGVRLRVDVLDEEVGLAVGEHASEVELGDAAIAQQLPEELALGG